MTMHLVRRHVRENIYLVVCLAIAAYLSLAALAAIPVLEESSSTALAELSTFRDELRAPERRLTVRQYAAADPFQAVEAVLARPQDTSPFPPDNPDIRTTLESQVASGRQRREKLLTEHAGANGIWQTRVNRARQQAFADVNANVERKGNLERRQHYAALIGWFEARSPVIPTNDSSG